MNKNRKLLLAALLLTAFAAFKLVLLQWWQAQQPQQPQAVAAQCDLTEGCTLPDGSRVRAAAVSTKKLFDIYIEHAPAGTEQVSISFSMKNMDMGFNRYMFERQPSGTWQAARIRLPVCVEGRRDFTADITIGSRTFQTAFTAE